MHKPYIIIGTEPWLSSDFHNNEIIPEYCSYIIYWDDRSDGYGIAVSKQFTSSEIALFQTNCEILWTQIIMNNGANLYFGTHYRLHIYDQYSIALPTEII